MKCQSANSRRNPYLWQPLAMLVPSGAVSACWLSRSAEAESWPDSSTAGVTELEVESEFSQIVVTKQGNVRSLIFVDSDGQEAVETELDLDKPHRLLLPYVFKVSHRRSLVVVGSLAKERERVGDLRLRAKQLDQRFHTTFSFEELLKDLRQ